MKFGGKDSNIKEIGTRKYGKPREIGAFLFGGEEVEQNDMNYWIEKGNSLREISGRINRGDPNKIAEKADEREATYVRILNDMR